MEKEVAIIENLVELEQNSNEVVKDNSDTKSTSQQIIESNSQSELSLKNLTNEVVNDEDQSEVIKEELENVDAPPENVENNAIESTQNSSVDTIIPFPEPSLSNISNNIPNDTVDDKKQETVKVRLKKTNKINQLKKFAIMLFCA